MPSPREENKKWERWSYTSKGGGGGGEGGMGRCLTSKLDHLSTEHC